MTPVEYRRTHPPGQEGWGGIPEEGRMGSLRRPRIVRGILSAVLLLATLQGCVPPDTPSLLPAELPAELLAALQPHDLRSLAAGAGVGYYGLRVLDQPWALHLLRVELDRCDLGLRVVSSPPSMGMAGGRLPVTALFSSGGENIVGGVNGDFFTPEGLTVGTEVVQGEVRRVRFRPAFAWSPGRDPWMGTPTVEGDSILMVGWPVDRRVALGRTEVIGGFPLLLRGGRRVGDLEVSALPSFSAARHPRTALGFDPRQRVLWMVVVDGRQPEHSDGMSLPELTAVLESLGATEAVNLDGGGSSIMVVKGVPVSRPSDAGGERAVVNALAVVRDRTLCRFSP